MDVGVDEPGGDEPSLEVDRPLRPVARSETDDAGAGDGDGSLVDLGGKDVYEASVLEKKVGGLISSRGGEEAPRVHGPL